MKPTKLYLVFVPPGFREMHGILQMGICNYCTLMQVVRGAEAGGRECIVVPADFRDEPRLHDLFPEAVDVLTINGEPNKIRPVNWHGTLMALPDHCVC